MNRKEVLVFGQDEAMRETAGRLINNNRDLLGIVASTAEDAIEKFHRFNIDVAVLINDIGEEQTRKLRKIFTLQNEGLIILQPDAVDESDRLCNEVRESLEKQKLSEKPSWSFIDDALKGTGLDIHIE